MSFDEWLVALMLAMFHVSRVVLLTPAAYSCLISVVQYVSVWHLDASVQREKLHAATSWN